MNLELCMYEGYLRNRKQLLAELSLEEGSSRKETEERIILEGYRRWKKNAPAHFFGSFSFAIKDTGRGECFCSRDAFGIESFYYYRSKNGEVLFSTNIKSIVEDPSYSKDIDDDALQLFCIFGYPTGEKTLYQGVKKLLPGRSLILRDGEILIERWFIPRFVPDDERTLDDWVDAVEETFEKVLKEDRENLDYAKCASFLSGGVDSSYLLTMSDIPDAYNMNFEESVLKETEFAKRTAGTLGTCLHTLDISRDDYFKALPDFVKCTELPVVDASGAAFFMGCSRIGEEKSIVFSGEGADEFFAGYHVYRRLDELGCGEEPNYFGCDGVMPEKEAMRFLGQNLAYPIKELLKESFDRSADPLSRMLSADIALWLEGDILLCVGRSAGGCDKKAILPYTDPRMFDLSAKMPSAYKLKDDIGKYALRCAAERKLPFETAFRKKAGSVVPVREWFREEKPRVEKVIFSKESSSFFDGKMLRNYWESYLNGGFTEFRIVFAVYMFMIWYENVYMKGQSS